MLGLIQNLLLAGSALALSPVTIEGNAFYNGSDERFYIRGVDYQPGGSSKISDPLANATTCKRDIEEFQNLGLNTIRVYTVDNSVDHDECMTALADAGIYVLVDVNTPKQSLNRLDEDHIKLSYNSGYLQHVFATIDAFKDYDNTLGFFAANEVINDVNNTFAAPYIKAVVRDMKSYISAQANRTIPVGYSAADVADNRWQQMSYLNCGNDSERIDMFGMNDYSWCGDASNFQISGWSTNVNNYKNYSIPMFLSEFGCNTHTPRTFPEIGTLYSDKMSSVYSGGLVYEFINEANNYGLVDVDDNGEVTERDDYKYLKDAFSKAVNPSGDGGASTDREVSQCPAYDDDLWHVQPDSDLPQMPEYAKRYLSDGAGEGLGLDTSTTQNGSYNDIPKEDNDEEESTTEESSSTATDDSVTSAASSAASSATSTRSSSSSSSSSSGSSSTSGNGAFINAPNTGIVALLLALATYF